LDNSSGNNYNLAMIATESTPHSAGWTGVGLQPLENGAHLSAFEFIRRYDAMPEVKKAELVNGIVYMASPIQLDQHGEPDALIQTWLGTYGIATFGVKHATNSTTRLGPDDVPQPDALLRILPECGGQARLDAKGYLQGAPELVIEVAASSTSIDAREKLASYRRAGVREYLLWRTMDQAVDWWLLENDEYHPLPAGTDRIIHSRVFPGLWLDVAALIARDGVKLMAKLREGLESAEHAGFEADLRKRSSNPSSKPSN
jgi:Uma2 family endonuclease